MSLNITDVSKIVNLVKDFNLLITSIADFGLLGLGTDYIDQLSEKKQQFSNLGIESVLSPINDFIASFKLRDFESMSSNLFYLYNWTALYSKKLHIMSLSLDIKDESILEKSKESIELFDEKDITFIPLSLIIEQVEDKKKYFELELRWVGLSYLNNNPEIITITTFKDKAFTKYKYDNLFFIQERIKSSFFVNQVVTFNNLINSPIEFKKVGIQLQENTDDPIFNLQYTINTFPSFSTVLAKEQLLEIVDKSPITWLNYNRNCSITQDEKKLLLTIKKEDKTYNIQCDNVYLLMQLYLLNFSGMTVDIVLMGCNYYHQFRDKKYVSCKQDKASTYHAITINQGGENIVTNIQQFNIRINYYFVFDKLLLKFSKPIDSLENIINYLYILQNSQIPKKNPKIKKVLTEIDNYIESIFSFKDKVNSLLTNTDQLLSFTTILEYFENPKMKEVINIIVDYIVNLDKENLKLDSYKKYLVILGIVVKLARERRFLENKQESKIEKFSNMYRMKVSSIESLIVGSIKNKSTSAFQNESENFMKSLSKTLESPGKWTHDIEIEFIISKKLFHKYLNLTIFEKRKLELQTIWLIVHDKGTLFTPLYFYYLLK